MDRKVVAVLQARTTSSRLPGKVLKPILGQPMILRQIERLKRSRLIDTIVVATSTDATDDRLAGVCANAQVICSRGSLTDVLDRVYRAAEPFTPSHVVRLTGDCPLTDWAVIDQVIELALTSGADFACNTQPPTFPDGLDAEVCTFAALSQAWREAEKAWQREHVMPFLYETPGRFKIANLRHSEDLSAHRWTVDEPADFAFVTAIYEGLYAANPAFAMADIIAFIAQHPEIASLNDRFQRNEGFKRG
ncbi:MAG: spore coat protein [Rhodospirillaceae bacterium]|nr:spore coat protein [Rhodospirillaceae bacterium]